MMLPIDDVVHAALIAFEAVPIYTETEIENPPLLLKPTAFPLYLEKYKTENKQIRVKIHSEQDMHKLVDMLFTDLPHTVFVSSTTFKAKQLKALYEEAVALKSEETTPTKHGLSNYSVKTTNQLILTDNAHIKYNAATIQEAVNHYIADLAPSLKADTEIETILNIYDFLYENFKYTANNYQNMLVGNLGTGEMACNGFSYLADQLFEAVGIHSTIRAGDSHYWNVLTLANGKEVTFDVTTDIVLNKYQATLGTSTKQHIEKASPIGFFSATFPEGKYHDVTTFSQRFSRK